MISKNEIFKNAERYNLLPSTIEKDYIIGWILAGLYKNDFLNQSIVFKGGTCLKKCFFNEYRFSEDLDFTKLKGQDINISKLESSLEKVFNWVEEESGNEIARENVKFEEHTNDHGIKNIQAKIPYGGPLKEQSRRNWPKIKFDITLDEELIDSSDRRQLFHEYSDKSESFPKIQSYSLEEVLGEKLRALNDRCRPRDLYDVVNLFENYDNSLDKPKVKFIYRKKCEFKNLGFQGLENYEKYKEECASGWKQQLSHQINNLEEFDSYWQRSKEIIQSLSQIKEMELTESDKKFLKQFAKSEEEMLELKPMLDRAPSS